MEGEGKEVEREGGGAREGEDRVGEREGEKEEREGNRTKEGGGEGER